MESDREEENIMTIKLEREELRTIMQEAMAAGESRAMGPLTAAARSGGDVDERGEVFAVSIKLADFWSEDPESWFDRADNQFLLEESRKTRPSSRTPYKLSATISTRK